MPTIIKRVIAEKDKQGLKTVVSEAKKHLKDGFNKSSQSELLELIEQKSHWIFNSTGEVVEVSGTLGKENTPVYNVFATTTQGTKIKLGKQHLDNVESLVKELPINVVLRFNALNETPLVKEDKETVESFAKREKTLAGLIQYAVEFDGKKGYVLFDSITW